MNQGVNHVTYKPDGVAGTALVSVKKINVIGRGSATWQIGTVADDRQKTIGSWSLRFGTCRVPAARGEMCRLTSGRGVRSTRDGGVGASTVFGRGCWPRSPESPLGPYGISTARISSFIRTGPTLRVGRPSRRSGAPRAASIPSWPPPSMRMGGRSACVWLRDNATTSKLWSRFYPDWQTPTSWPIAASMRILSIERLTRQGSAPASGPNAGATGDMCSTKATTVNDTGSKISFAESSDTDESPPAMTNSQTPSYPSFSSPLSSIGSLTRFENTP
jgi:hypothetical protein